MFVVLIPGYETDWVGEVIFFFLIGPTAVGGKDKLPSYTELLFSSGHLSFPISEEEPCVTQKLILSTDRSWSNFKKDYLTHLVCLKN